MSMCRCCGQSIETAAAPSTIPATPKADAINVDNGVLAVCNSAYEEAVRRGSGEVEIAHLAMALAATAESAVVLHSEGLTTGVVGQAAQAWLRQWERRGDANAATRTSAEMKALLRMAQGRAALEGRTYAGLTDVVHALLKDASGLWSAAFVASLSGPSPAPAARQPQAATAQNMQTGFAPDDFGNFTSPQKSLLERDYAWVLARERTAAPDQTAAQPRPPQQSSTGRTPARVELEQRASDALRSAYPQDRATSQSAREPTASTAAPKTGEDATANTGEVASLLRTVVQRQEHQDRQFSQRLDMQQRMLTELAETFARTLREMSKLREPTPGVSAAALSASSLASPKSASGAASGTSSQRARRSRFRRHAWSSWQRSRRQRSLWRRDPRAASDSEFERGTWTYADPEGHAVPQPSTYRAQGNDPAIEDNAEEQQDREKRFYLSLDDDIEKAPSIGARTAAQLSSAGVVTVRELLACNPSDVAAKMSVRYITAERIALWQSQSRLVCSIPWLRGTHAQLLAGAGYDTIEKIVAADASSVCADILRFAATRDGQSVLRSSPPPGADWVEKRLEHARIAEPQRAAA